MLHLALAIIRDKILNGTETLYTRPSVAAQKRITRSSQRNEHPSRVNENWQRRKCPAWRLDGVERAARRAVVVRGLALGAARGALLAREPPARVVAVVVAAVRAARVVAPALRLVVAPPRVVLLLQPLRPRRAPAPSCRTKHYQHPIITRRFTEAPGPRPSHTKGHACRSVRGPGAPRQSAHAIKHHASVGGTPLTASLGDEAQRALHEGGPGAAHAARARQHRLGRRAGRRRRCKPHTVKPKHPTHQQLHSFWCRDSLSPG